MKFSRYNALDMQVLQGWRIVSLHIPFIEIEYKYVHKTGIVHNQIVSADIWSTSHKYIKTLASTILHEN